MRSNEHPQFDFFFWVRGSNVHSQNYLFLRRTDRWRQDWIGLQVDLKINGVGLLRTSNGASRFYALSKWFRIRIDWLISLFLLDFEFESRPHCEQANFSFYDLFDQKRIMGTALAPARAHVFSKKNFIINGRWAPVSKQIFQERQKTPIGGP